MTRRYRDRRDAGRELGRRLSVYAGRSDVLVLALPRGGVPVGFEVARTLRVPLDIVTVRKLGVPGFEELAFGAVASGGFRVINQDIVQRHRIPAEAIETVTGRERVELQRRETHYRARRPAPVIAGQIVILVDDGLATGATMQVAIQAVRAQGPARLVVGVPVGAPDICHMVGRAADEIICARSPDPFDAVGLWYDDFRPTSDGEVVALLREAEHDDERPEGSDGGGDRT